MSDHGFDDDDVGQGDDADMDYNNEFDDPENVEEQKEEDDEQPMDVVDFGDEQQAQKVKELIPIEERITTRYLTKYEKARIVEAEHYK